MSLTHPNDPLILVVWGVGVLICGLFGMLIGIRVIEELLDMIGIRLPESLANFVWAMSGAIGWTWLCYKWFP